jgi:uncharacterized protein YbjT (DUF2867 family)
VNAELPSEGRTVVVFGATGKQGGAAARHLAGAGWRVRAVTRDPSGAAAQSLSARGVECVEASFDEPATLRAALDGAYGVFSVQPAVHAPDAAPDYDADTEARWGCSVADAAAAAGVTHLVYMSIPAAKAQTGVPSFDSKWRIEQHIAKLGLPATVLRPGTFLENFVDPAWNLQSGTLASGLAPHTKDQLIAVDDIGAFAAIAFAVPARFLGQSVVIAGDELTTPQLAELITLRAGFKLDYAQVPTEVLAGISADLAAVFAYLNEQDSYGADIPALRRLHPGLLDVNGWLDAGGADALAALRHE